MLSSRVPVLQKYTQGIISGYSSFFLCTSLQTSIPETQYPKSHRDVLGLHSYQQFGKTPDYLPGPPSVQSCGKISHSNTFNMSKEEGRSHYFFFSSRYTNAFFWRYFLRILYMLYKQCISML